MAWQHYTTLSAYLPLPLVFGAFEFVVFALIWINTQYVKVLAAVIAALVARGSSRRHQAKLSLGNTIHAVDIYTHLVAKVHHTADVFKENLQDIAVGIADFKSANTGLVAKKCFCAHNVDFFTVKLFILFIYLIIIKFVNT